MRDNKPLRRVVIGNIAAAIWENTITVNGTAKTLMKISVNRRYKDKESGEWKTSGSFSRNEAFQAIWCLAKAVGMLIEEENANKSGSNGVQEEVVM